MAGNQGNNRIVWKGWQVSYLKSHWQTMTSQQLADKLGLKRTIVRMKLYDLGLKKMVMERWTPAQVECLTRNYKTIGDTEMAEIFTRRWKKQKGWSKKHIEKKRRQRGLKRTKSETAYIRKRNIEKGRFRDCPIKAWKTRVKAKEKEVRVWDSKGIPRLYIKIRGRFTPYAPWLYKQNVGKVKKGYVVRIKDGNPYNIKKENLELIPLSQHGPANKKQSPEYKREQAKALLKYQIEKNEKQIK